MDTPSPEPPLTLLPEVEARVILGDRDVRFRVLRPPFPAAGTGTLRVLRVREREGRTEVVAGYDGYVRLGHVRP